VEGEEAVHEWEREYANRRIGAGWGFNLGRESEGRPAVREWELEYANWRMGAVGILA
jgi:hypothetical protein